MGYDPVDVAASVTNFKSRTSRMLGYGLKAFYAGCYGSANSIGTNKEAADHILDILMSQAVIANLFF
ncbi:hypothetical protein [Fusobacterium gastrosuis]|uniref:hypothetical protein n=1 Tax=Fusobacterium gastrosuis TaxID=1755100 RepID=UPI0029701AE7|nr:hypothetical protein [Fusobacteriaceae bacterium]MDY5714151.1 hypothetical protein [Fusobacterium gastrosuis]